MNAYRIPGRAELDDVEAEARLEARRTRLLERLRLIDALVGSPERARAAGGASASALLGMPFFLAGVAAFWFSEASFQLFSTVSLAGFGLFAAGFIVTWASGCAFRFARFLTRRSLAKLP